MSRDVSLSFLEAVYAPETGESFAFLVTIEHEELEESVRFTNVPVNYNSSEGFYFIESRGDTFSYVPLQITLATSSNVEPPKIQIVIDNIHRDLVTAIREIQSPLGIKTEIVRASDPDTVEAVFPDFKLFEAVYDRIMVQGDLRIELMEDEPYPAETYNPSTFPGLFG